MARILIRPEDLARLAQRFDASAEDLLRASRRLTREREEVSLNRADDTFPFGPFAARSTLVEANLRRLARELQVDAGLMARTVDDAEVGGDGEPGGRPGGPWTAGLAAGSDTAIGAAATSPARWQTVASGLLSLEAGSDLIGEQHTNYHPPVGAAIASGGLFRSSSTSDGEGALLGGLAEQIVRSSSVGSGSDGASAGDSAADVWTRIVNELFVADEGSVD